MKMKSKKQRKVHHQQLRKKFPRLPMLTAPKYVTPKLQTTDTNAEFKSTLSQLRLSERIIASAMPYERVLLETQEKYGHILNERSKRSLEEAIQHSQNSIYAKLTKRPLCSGVPIPLREPPKMDEREWARHRAKLKWLAQPKPIRISVPPKRKCKKLSELMPRIIELAKTPPWSMYVRLSQDPAFKDPCKLRNPKALSYKPTPRMIELAKPRYQEDKSIESLIETTLWEGIIKRLNNKILMRKWKKMKESGKKPLHPPKKK